MKQYVYEFEMYEDKDSSYWVVDPIGLGGATEGYSRADAIDMAADWLYITIEDMLENKKEIPKPIYGSELKHKNSERLVVSVSL